MKDNSQTKRTSLTESFAAMVGMKPKEKEEVIPANEKGKTFGTVSAITTEAKQVVEQVTQGATANQAKKTWNQKQLHLSLATSGKVGTNRQKAEMQRGRPPRAEKGNTTQTRSPGNYVLARATEEKLQQMAD